MASTLRFDVTTGDWVAFSGVRAERPDAYAARNGRVASVPPIQDPNCPFCPGREARTPEPTEIVADPDDPARWSVRIFPNKFPVLEPQGSVERRVLGPLFREMDGHGCHELVVESPEHGRVLWDQPLEHVKRLVTALQRRARALGRDPTLEVVQIFKNHGSRAGSSMPHPHFQILATPIVPRQMRDKYVMAAEYYNANGVSVYSELCRTELEANVRIVTSNDEFVVFTPFASRSPYETWIVPRRPAATFDNADPATLEALPAVLLDTLKRVALALGGPPFNLVINSAAHRHADEPDFVWHIEIVPRLSTTAGFELATGMAINSVLPETAAEVLRKAL